jgi:hypothetical protein
MLKNALLAGLLAASMIAVPQPAAANPCGLNCVYVTVFDGHGNALYSYWDCPIEMECVEP